MLSDREISFEREAIRRTGKLKDEIEAILGLTTMRNDDLTFALLALPDTATWELQLCEQKDEA